MKSLIAMTAAALLLAGLAGCEQKGPVEQAGEEVDEAVDTIKRGGEESNENRLDDAADQVRDAGEELKEE